MAAFLTSSGQGEGIDLDCDVTSVNLIMTEGHY